MTSLCLLFIFLLLFLIGLAFIKATLFWLYLWQIKEYRFDRFLAEYGRINKLIRFWLFSGGRKIHQPVWTIKATLIYLISLLVTGGFIWLLVNNYRPIYNYWLLIISLIVFYFLAPLIVSFLVILFKIPTYFLKKLICYLAAKKITAFKSLIVIGITGSYGKSSTKEFLAQILSPKFKVAKTPVNINTEIGVAQFILKNLKNDLDIFVVEMAAYKRWEIKKICQIVKPKIGILTGISEQHLALFGSLENIKKVKFELIESLPSDGLAVFNGENKYCLEIAEKWKGKKIIYRDTNIRMHTNDTNIKKMPQHYLLNLAGAIEVARYLKMNEEEIQKAMARIKLTNQMIKTFAAKNDTLIIDDTYSANPDGVLVALDYLASQPQKTKIVVMPCLIELGKTARQIHQKIGQKIAENCDFAIIITSDYFKEIKIYAGDKAILETNPQKLIELLKDRLNSGTVILLEGRISEKIIQELKQ